ncbi:hypothetical protein [Streptomyces sp. YS-3]|uniref:hypothetical protein n=1 Tax=Streptomyces sp. YS-3 TaxID=3381352 RepID=UPI00386271C0
MIVLRAHSAWSPKRLPPRTTPEDEFTGRFSGPPEVWSGDAIEIAWMEAGSEWLSIIRDGQVVHQGRHALTRTTTSKPRITTVLGAGAGRLWTRPGSGLRSAGRCGAPGRRSGTT